MGVVVEVAWEAALSVVVSSVLEVAVEVEPLAVNDPAVDLVAVVEFELKDQASLN